MNRKMLYPQDDWNFHCLSRNDAKRKGGDEKIHWLKMSKVLGDCSWRCCQLPQILFALEPCQTRELECTAERTVPKESDARWGRQELIATVGQRAVALLWLYFHSDSNMCGGTAHGHLSLCCKDSSGISCVVTSERILLSVQKQKTLPYGCFTINQDTYQCYFCCLMLTTPHFFLRP